MHPTELAYPCCLPALGEFGKMPPHGGLAQSLGERRTSAKAARVRAADLPRGDFVTPDAAR